MTFPTIIPHGVRSRLLATTALLSLALLGSMPARAADLPEPTDIAQAAFEGKTTVSVYGGFLFNDSDAAFGVADGQSKLGDLSDLGPGRDGGAFGLSVGHTIDPTWDWKLAAEVDAFESEKTTGGVDAFARSDFGYQIGDFEVGHRTTFANGDSLRLFAGPRILHGDSDIDYGHGGGTPSDYHSDAHFWAAGPRIGAEGVMPLGASLFSLHGSVAGAVLFAAGDQHFEYNTGSPGSSESRLSDPIWNAAISASLAYNFTPNTTLEIGYKAEQFWNLAPSVADATDAGTITAGQADVLAHGPFVKFTATLP